MSAFKLSVHCSAFVLPRIQRSPPVRYCFFRYNNIESCHERLADQAVDQIGIIDSKIRIDVADSLKCLVCREGPGLILACVQKGVYRGSHIGSQILA
jgi:hypothetical protein